MGPVAYKLTLPATSKIHPVFHVSLLKKAVQAPAETVFPPELEMGQDEILRPKAVLATRLITEQQEEIVQWLIQWEDQDEENATWEDASIIKAQFPQLSLEDKTPFEGAGNDGNTHKGTTEDDTHKPLLVYSRRGIRAKKESG